MVVAIPFSKGLSPKVQPCKASRVAGIVRPKAFVLEFLPHVRRCIDPFYHFIVFCITVSHADF
jgi:hypothetical protein